MDVHLSSGVYNKAFYLLATTNRWNTRKAFEVFVKANRDYWTPSTDFIEGAFDVRDAAQDLGYTTADSKPHLRRLGCIWATWIRSRHQADVLGLNTTRAA
jgi:Zn-dependent metalloprotease